MASWPYNTDTWQTLRRVKLASDPLCHACRLRGILTPARAVDHVRAIADGGHAFPPLNELMSLCFRCHNEKTASLDRSHSKPFARRFKGFDADGNPIDPGDAWHRGGIKDEKALGAGPIGEACSYLVSDEEGPENGA